jgi:sugar phosphate isomerase/epimerase
LAEWSVNSLLFSKKLDHLDFALEAKKHGIFAVEYVNQFFIDKAKDFTYLKEMNTRCTNEGITQVLIMVDREGMLGARAAADRTKAVENHKKWIDAAKFLGCHTVRVNGYSDISWSTRPEDAAEASKLVSDSIHQLATYAAPTGIHIVIENHGGFSSNGKWLADTIRNANHPLAGTLPDFGNFRISTLDGKPVSYDSYRGVDELMPLATGVSLKPKVWDDAGQESDLDYARMMKIVLSHGYSGHVGIEHGDKDNEWESIVAIRQILEGLQKA